MNGDTHKNSHKKNKKIKKCVLQKEKQLGQEKK